jgi:hypothetical protein
MENVNIREFRQNLARYTQGKTYTLVGDRWHPRALVIPLFSLYTWNRAERRAVIAQAQRNANKALHALRHGAD